MSDDVTVSIQPPDHIGVEEEQEELFDFAGHRSSAVEEYRRIRGRYEAFAQAVRDILVQS